MPGICGFIFTDAAIDWRTATWSGCSSRIRQFDWQHVERAGLGLRVTPPWGVSTWESCRIAPRGRQGVQNEYDTTYHARHGEEGDGFTRVDFDLARGHLAITCDPFGMMPLFYAEVAGGLVFATELKSVLAHPAVECRIDERGLADFLTFGFLMGEKYRAGGRDVRCLPGGALSWGSAADRTASAQPHMGVSR